jgi:hypothetical protein
MGFFKSVALSITNATVKLTEIPNANAWINKASPEQLARIAQGGKDRFRLPAAAADNDPPTRSAARQARPPVHFTYDYVAMEQGRQAIEARAAQPKES